jgi:hypothetical protein
MSQDDLPIRPPRSIQLVEDRWANVRHIVEAIAIVAAGLWAFYVFVYQEDIKPANEPAGLNLSIAVHRLGRDAHHDILVLTTTYRNAGKTEIDIAADGFDLWGIRYASRASYRSSQNARKAEFSYDIPERTRTLVKASMELRAAALGGPNNHIIMEPDDTVSIDNTVVLTRGAYESVEAFVIASPIKTSVRDKMLITIVREPDRGLWLQGSGDFNEDDNKSDFALIP